MTIQTRRRLVAFLALAAARVAADPLEHPIPTDFAVQVMLFFDPLLGYSGVVTYNHLEVSREQARAELSVLAGALGLADVEELRPFDLATGKRGAIGHTKTADGTEVTFKTSEQWLDRNQGTLRLEPVIKAFAHYRRINLEYLVSDLNGRAFAYRGVGSFENDRVRMRHEGSTGHHSFQVDVLVPSFESLDLPPFAPPEVPLGGESNTAPGDKVAARRQAGAVVLGLGLSLLVYVLLSGYLTKRRTKTKPRRRRWHR